MGCVCKLEKSLDLQESVRTKKLMQARLSWRVLAHRTALLRHEKLPVQAHCSPLGDLGADVLQMNIIC